MPADPTAAHSDDRSRHCLTLTASAEPNGECGRVVRISRRSQHKPFAHPREPSPRKRAARDRTRNLAPSISLLRVIAEGAGS